MSVAQAYVVAILPIIFIWLFLVSFAALVDSSEMWQLPIWAVLYAVVLGTLFYALAEQGFFA